jgi:hypothetical protein
MARKKDRGFLPWGRHFWILNQTWTRVFILSHLFGWATAFFQTFWIVYEIRKYAKGKGFKKSIDLVDGRRNQS